MADMTMVSEPALGSAAMDHGSVPPAPSLAPRQDELLRLLAQGLTAKEAAARMGLTTYSVRKLAARTYQRVGGAGLVGTLYRIGWVVTP